MNTYNSPIEYYPNFLSDPDRDLEYFMNIEWDNRTSARKEAFFATVTDPYTYGTGEFARSYTPRPMDPLVYAIGGLSALKYDCDVFELCFLNRYDDARQALGWHADDAESIDHSRPIAVVSLGAERELWTKPIGGDFTTVEKILLGHGSLLIMKPGMQHTHLHRIPKHDRECSTRISLTYRGFKS